MVAWNGVLCIAVNVNTLPLIDARGLSILPVIVESYTTLGATLASETTLPVITFGITRVALEEPVEIILSTARVDFIL